MIRMDGILDLERGNRIQNYPKGRDNYEPGGSELVSTSPGSVGGSERHPWLITNQTMKGK